jgi:hypothetical protein
LKQNPSPVIAANIQAHLKELEIHIVTITDSIEKELSRFPASKSLQTVKGVSVITTATLLAELPE